jgi:hypothetical protein
VGALAVVPVLFLLSLFTFTGSWWFEKALFYFFLTTLPVMIICYVITYFAVPLVAAETSTARFDRIGYVFLVVGLVLIALANEYLFR